MKTLMKELKPQLEAQGFAVFYKEADNSDATDQLILPVAREDGSALSIEINAIADPEGMYPQSDLIQIFMTISMQIDPNKFQDVSQLLSQINLELALGSFNLHLSGIIFFKYTYIAAKNEQKIVQPLIDAIDISNHVFQSYEPHIVNFLNA
jgi:hypothetical protein